MHFRHLSSFLFLAVDEVPPQILGCPSNIDDTVDLGVPGKVMTWPEPSSTDNSGTSTMTSRSHTPNSFFPVGVTEVTYIFSDPSSNTADCMFTITIREGESVVIPERTDIVPST